MDSPGVEPWDAAAMTDALVDLVTQLPRERLDRLDAPQTPGSYLQFLDAPHMGDVFGEPTATGVRAAYVGVASRSLRSRVARYRRALAGMSELSEDQVWVTLVPCASTASARFAESALIERLRPALQGLGWGSRPPGAGRPGKSPSPIDALLVGRDWAEPADVIDQVVARLAVVVNLVRADTSGPRWPALTRRPPRH